MAENAKAGLLASLIGDSLALSAHWEYDTEALAKAHGRVADLAAPAPGSYHYGKPAGGFTHYGDQAMVLLQSVAAMGRFDLADFSGRWQTLFKGYQGYVDQATKQTLANFKAKAMPDASGSDSNDLAGAARIAPLTWLMADDLGGLIPAARAQTKMTHNHPQVVAAAEFFARTTHSVQMGMSPVRALQEAAGHRYAGARLADWVDRGLASKETGSVAAIGALGQSCHIDHAFPAVIHLIARHAKDLETALIENVMAGGDSAARGLLVGLILGGHLGMKAIPARWFEGLAQSQAIWDMINGDK